MARTVAASLGGLIHAAVGTSGVLRLDSQEAQRICEKSSLQRRCRLLCERCSASVVQRFRRHSTDARMSMLVVVPMEELLTVSARILGAAKALGKVRTVLQCFKLTSRVRIVVRNMRTTARFGQL